MALQMLRYTQTPFIGTHVGKSILSPTNPFLVNFFLSDTSSYLVKGGFECILGHLGESRYIWISIYSNQKKKKKKWIS